MKTRTTVHFEPATLRQIDELATRKRLTKSAVIEAAVASYLSPDGSDRLEAAFARRLDRLSRQLDRLERDVSISGEALGLFVRFWLAVTPPLPETAQAAAQAKGRERYEGFIETLGRRLAKGHSILKEVSEASQKVTRQRIALDFIRHVIPSAARVRKTLGQKGPFRAVAGAVSA